MSPKALAPAGKKLGFGAKMIEMMKVIQRSFLPAAAAHDVDVAFSWGSMYTCTQQQQLAQDDPAAAAAFPPTACRPQQQQSLTWRDLSVLPEAPAKIFRERSSERAESPPSPPNHAASSADSLTNRVGPKGTNNNGLLH